MTQWKMKLPTYTGGILQLTAVLATGNLACMNRRPLPSPNRLFAWYEAGEISREQWLEGMRQLFLIALSEIEEEQANPRFAFMERWRCQAAARKLLKDHNQAELREIFMSLAEIDDFPPAHYLWNADQYTTPLYCFLREKQEPVLRFTKVSISRLRADISIEYGGLKADERIRERITFRRDWRGVMVVESRE